MKKGKKSSVMTAITMLLVVVLVTAAFLQLKKAKEESEKKRSDTEVDKLLGKDLELSYPGNAREVVKLYNRIVKCFYNEELTEEELTGLASQARILFDTELIKYNPMNSYLENLKADIQTYKEEKRTISNVEVQDYSDVRFETKGSEKTASLLAYYLLKEGKESRKSYMRFYLREDEDGKWRILFWEVTNETFEI